VFTINTILTRKYYVCILHTNLAVVCHAKSAYKSKEVIYHTMVYSTLLRDTYLVSCSSSCTFRFPRQPLYTTLVGWRHDLYVLAVKFMYFPGTESWPTM
jgi:hypothetical protein